MNRYESSKELYGKIGVDTDLAIEKLKNIPVSLHCWQGDDVKGFDIILQKWYQIKFQHYFASSQKLLYI